MRIGRAFRMVVMALRVAVAGRAGHGQTAGRQSLAHRHLLSGPRGAQQWSQGILQPETVEQDHIRPLDAGGIRGPGMKGVGIGIRGHQRLHLRAGTRHRRGHIGQDGRGRQHPQRGGGRRGPRAPHGNHPQPRFHRRFLIDNLFSIIHRFSSAANPPRRRGRSGRNPYAPTHTAGPRPNSGDCVARGKSA